MRHGFVNGVRKLKVDTSCRLQKQQTSTLKRLIFAKDLKSMKSESQTPEVQPCGKNTVKFEELMKRRFFYGQSFEIYGGVSGLYDYGPPACLLQANIISLWRRHFVIEEGMLEVDSTSLTPFEVLKTSGHVDKFTDLMCKDATTGEHFRADHLVKDALERLLLIDKTNKLSIGNTKKQKGLTELECKEMETVLAQIDNYDASELSQLIKRYEIKNPKTGGNLNDPIAFNLMFETQIGPSGGSRGFLRPETAQGQFINFNRLYEFNRKIMPFASASVGKSFRNEISPRSGLLRVREFMMAEIEHYVDPENKNHQNFDSVRETTMPFLSRKSQLAGSEPIMMTIGEAVDQKIVDNTTLGYFLARIYEFLVKIGIKRHMIRFRQHLDNEMAHYATDCWDAELKTFSGWIECVGCADRSAFDLTVHSKYTGVPLVVRETLSSPIIRNQLKIELDKKVFGPVFRKDAKLLEEFMSNWSQKELEKRKQEAEENNYLQVEIAGKLFKIDSELFTIQSQQEKIFNREYIPNVIEPSFGIGRILYCVLEHSYWNRASDENRGVLSIPPIIAPTKVLLVPLSSNKVFEPLVRKISQKLRSMGISNIVDASSAVIGRKYARNDELGTPFGITVDFQSVEDDTITLRERDSTKQIRASQDQILKVLEDLCLDKVTWQVIVSEYEKFTAQELS